MSASQEDIKRQIVRVLIHENGDSWYGEVHIDGGNLNVLKLNGINMILRA
jgi:hypothetical protein